MLPTYLLLLRSSPTISLLRRPYRNLCVLSLSSEGTKACIPCAGMDESHLLPLATLPDLVSNRLPLWALAEDGKSISRTLVARNFQAALDAMNDMGVIAEEQSHHPDFHLTSYRNVQVDIYTHSLGGITENDLILAQALDEVDVDYSPKWLKEHPEATKKAEKRSS